MQPCWTTVGGRYKKRRRGELRDIHCKGCRSADCSARPGVESPGGGAGLGWVGGSGGDGTPCCISFNCLAAAIPRPNDGAPCLGAETGGAAARRLIQMRCEESITKLRNYR